MPPYTRQKIKKWKEIFSSIVRPVLLTSMTSFLTKSVAEYRWRPYIANSETGQLFRCPDLGFITPEELIEAAKNDGMEMTDEQTAEYIKDLDHNGNGKIEIQCLSRYWERELPSPYDRLLMEYEDT